jgi:hypothetical protein
MSLEPRFVHANYRRLPSSVNHQVSAIIPDSTRRTSAGSPRALRGSMSWRTPIRSLWIAGSRAPNRSELSKSAGGSPRVRGCAKSGTADCDPASAIKGWIPARKACPNPPNGRRWRQERPPDRQYPRAAQPAERSSGDQLLDHWTCDNDATLSR